MNRFVFLTIAILIGSISLYAKEKIRNHTNIIVASLNNNLQDISPLFFGVNSLYWIDDDKSRNDIKLIKNLKSLNISVIRYPGGEIADNFNWKLNILNDNNSFPYSKSIYDSQNRMNFDEFIIWKNSLGAEAIIVINLENGFIEKDLEKAANLAADWVRYSNIEKKYKIKYWEIGNESYHFGTRHALTAKQYAKALNLFSKKMKAIDNSIKIGAIGPFNVKVTPLINFLPETEIKTLRSKKTSKERKKFRQNYKKTLIESSNIDSWWKTVAEVAGKNFDFGVVHRYTPRRKVNDDIVKPLMLKNSMDKLTHFLNSSLQKNVPISITEYNIAKQSSLSEIYLSLTLAEMIGNFLEAGAFITNYWPLRFNDRRSILGIKKFNKKPAYHVFKAFSTNIGNKILDIKTDNDMIYTICTLDTKENILTLFIINKLDNSENININIPHPHIKSIYTQEINKKHKKLKKSKSLPKLISKGFWNFRLNPLSLTILKFKVK